MISMCHFQWDCCIFTLSYPCCTWTSDSLIVLPFAFPDVAAKVGCKPVCLGEELTHNHRSLSGWESLKTLVSCHPCVFYHWSPILSLFWKSNPYLGVTCLPCISNDCFCQFIEPFYIVWGLAWMCFVGMSSAHLGYSLTPPTAYKPCCVDPANIRSKHWFYCFLTGCVLGFGSCLYSLAT